MFILALANGYFFNWLNDYLQYPVGQQDIVKMSKTNKVLLLIVIGPVLETVLFQYLPISIAQRFTKKKWVIIFSSSVVFGLGHLYNPVYFTMAFFGGVICSYLFIYSEERKKSGILFCIVFHSLYNLYGLLFISD